VEFLRLYKRPKAMHHRAKLGSREVASRTTG
jgi:hypothetical protein